MGATPSRKIAIVVSHLAPAFGMERVALQTAHLLEKTYDVEVVCLGGSDADRELYPEARILGGPLRGWRRVKSFWRLHKVSGQLQADAIVLTGVWVALPWLLVVKRRKFATIVWEHSLLRRRASSSLQMRILALGARLLYGRSDGIIAVSEPLRRDVAALTSCSLVVTIPNPVETPEDADIPVPDLNGEQDIRLITVGSLTSIKAQEIAIRALALLDDKYTLIIAGAGPRKIQLQGLTRSLGLNSRVTFTGFLEPHELEKEMRSADFLVHCAHVETFGLVYVEAANQGLPVVAITNDVAEEMIPKFVPGWTCKANPSELAQEIARRASGSVDVADIYASASHRRSSFSSESVLGKWQETLASLTSQARSR